MRPPPVLSHRLLRNPFLQRQESAAVSKVRWTTRGSKGPETRHSALADEVLTTAQVAALLQISQRTLERMRITGSGPQFCKIGRAVRYRMSAVEKYLAARTIQSTAAAYDRGIRR